MDLLNQRVNHNPFPIAILSKTILLCFMYITEDKNSPKRTDCYAKASFQVRQGA